MVAFLVLKTKTALAVGEVVVGEVVVDEVVVAGVVEIGVVTSGAVVVLMQSKSSQGQPPGQFF